MEVILTSRPVSWKSPISWVNSITRLRTRSPFDHVAILYNGVVYESTSGPGVHCQLFREWTKGREGTYLFCYKIPKDQEIDFKFFNSVRGKKYDYWANILFLFGAKHGLKKHSTKRYFCSELVASMLQMKEPYLYTPDDMEEFMRISGWEPINRKVYDSIEC